MSRHEQARAILEALFQRRPPSEGISEARLYAMGREYPPDELGVSFGTVMLEEAEKMALGNRPDRMSRQDTLRINAVLAALPGWERKGKMPQTCPYGRQRSFCRIIAE